MTRYIGTKIITAEPMRRGAYNLFRGWTLPADENGLDDGYLVEYQDGGKPNVPGRAGYVSWSPKEQFYAAYRPCTAMTFGLAIEAMKRGYKVARAGWNGAGQWVALGSGNPLLDASQFWNPHARAHAEQNGGGATVLPYFILKTAQGAILMGWSPSQSDALAEDWQIVNSVETKCYPDGTAATGTAPLPDVSPGEQKRLKMLVDPVRGPGMAMVAQAAPHALPPHQKRVVEEKRELDERKEKLEAFFETPTFAQLDDSEQGRLHAQRNVMAAYSRILGERIAGFGLGDDVGIEASSSR
jgi:hypothetical protein